MVAIVEEKNESSSVDSRATEPILGSSLTPRDLSELLKLIPHAGDEVGPSRWRSLYRRDPGRHTALHCGNDGDGCTPGRTGPGGLAGAQFR